MIKLLNKNEKYILALSGGPDSIYLFNYLISKKIKNLVVCHVNYNYRNNSLYDENIVKKICELNNIKYFIKNINIDYNLLKENFESWARRERYNFFCEIAKIEKAKAILVAHNLNDNIETFIMQKNNNKTVSHYGINKISFYKNIKVIRPILGLKKSYILKKLNKKNIKYAIDETNNDTSYQRNKIRKNLKENDFKYYLKLIKKENKKIKKYNLKIKKINLKNSILINFFTKDQAWNKFLIFNFLIFNNFENLVFNCKKSLINEIIKLVFSKKSYIKFKKNNLILLKDYDVLRIVNNKDLNIFEINYDNKDYMYLLKKHNINFIDKNLLITNNWIKYQSKVYLENKLLSKIYKNNKTSYLKRFKNILIFNKSEKILLNKISI